MPGPKIISAHRFSGRKVCFSALLLGIATVPVAGAHDFWVQPSTFWMRPQAITPFTLQVGHGKFRQRSPIRLSRIIRFQAIVPNGDTIELRDTLHVGDQLSDGDLCFQTPGTYILVFETDARAQSHLPAIRFNDYLRVEGLTPALEQRALTNRMNADGSENYSRRAKAIILVGSPGRESQKQVTKPLGLPLEIIPEVSPYAQPRPAILPVLVNYDRRPLPGALVKLTSLEHDDAPLDMHLTDRDGRASFAMPNDGSWMLNVIWTRPSLKSHETDFETVFSSLSFGFPGSSQ